MPRIYVLCRDKIFRRMLEAELSAAGGEVLFSSDFTPPCAIVTDVYSVDFTAVPTGEDINLTVFGYEEELTPDIPPTANILLRPFETERLISLVFGESTPPSPELRKISASERLLLSPGARMVTLGGSTVKLSKREFALFEYLYERRGTAVSRNQLRRDIWGEGEDDGVVDVYICYLREKTEKSFGVRLIKTARGTGYMFEA